MADVGITFPSIFADAIVETRSPPLAAHCEAVIRNPVDALTVNELVKQDEQIADMAKARTGKPERRRENTELGTA
jgi:hypothetical protein